MLNFFSIYIKNQWIRFSYFCFDSISSSNSSGLSRLFSTPVFVQYLFAHSYWGHAAHMVSSCPIYQRQFLGTITKFIREDKHFACWDGTFATNDFESPLPNHWIKSNLLTTITITQLNLTSPIVKGLLIR